MAAPRPPALLAFALGLALTGCGAPQNRLDQPVQIVEQPFTFAAERSILLAGVPSAPGALPLVIFVEGDGGRCQGFSEGLWRRFLLRFTGRFVLVRPRTRVNAVCDTPAFEALDYAHRADELAAVVDAAERRWPGRRLYLLGHSAGAEIALTYSERHPGRVAGIVDLGGGLQAVGELLPAIEWARVARGEQTADEARARERDLAKTLAEVEANAGRPGPFWGRTHRFWAQLLFSRATQRWPYVKPPVLVVHGREDLEAVPFETVAAARETYARGGLNHVEFRFFDGLGHDLMTPVVMAVVDGWISAREADAAPPGGPAMPPGGAPTPAVAAPPLPRPAD